MKKLAIATPANIPLANKPTTFTERTPLENSQTPIPESKIRINITGRFVKFMVFSFERQG
jgi:hypothetical protein